MKPTKLKRIDPQPIALEQILRHPIGFKPMDLENQRGVALISMLLVFAIVVTMVGEMVSRMWFDIRTTDFFLKQAQARQYALGGEALARQLLFEDYETDDEANHEAGNSGRAVDHLDEPWSRISQTFQPDDGEIRLAIVDLQSRFNLNNLVNEAGEIDTIQLTIFERLLSQLNIETSLAGKLADWLDSDSIPGALDSEDIHYLGLESGYRTANRRIVDITELRAVDGVTPAIFKRLQAFICALPTATRININTASAALIASLVPGLDGNQVVAARERESFKSLDDFATDDSTAGLVIDRNLVSVNSGYFQIWTRAGFAGQVYYLESAVSRDPESGRITLLDRRLEPPAVDSETTLFAPPRETR